MAVTPRNWLLTTRLDNGALVAGYNRSGYGGRGIYIFGDALEPELVALKLFLKPGFVFIDIGANVGVFTVKAAKEVGDSGIVIAVEPFIESARQLSRNIELNGFRNCRIRNFCAGQVSGQVKFYKNKNAPNKLSLIEEPGADSLSVLCVTLNDLCEWEGITRLDYLKIDAEGAEEMILKGGAEVIARLRPIIQVEVNKCSSDVPQGYRRFSVPKGFNNMFIPSERADAIETAIKLGWAELN